MPIDEEVNQAIHRLYFGMTLPFWGNAVKLQLARLNPWEEQAVAIYAVEKRRVAGLAEPGDEKIMDFVIEEQKKPHGYQAWVLGMNSQVMTDGAFLLVAMRILMTHAERVVTELEGIGKEAAAKAALETYKSQYGLVKELRDVVIHHDEYATGGGRMRKMIKDPAAGPCVDQDDDGRLLFTWAGHSLPLLDAGRASLTLLTAMNQLFW